MRALGTEAVITGGEGDLAQVIAAQLSNHGFSVETPGRDQLDVTRQDSVENYFRNREVDLLVCTAGIIRDHRLALLTEKDWDDVVDVNLKGVLRCAHCCIDSMMKAEGGHIIMISSYSAIHPPMGQTAYATSKAALLGLTKEFANHYGSHNIRFNVVLPGFLETSMTDGVSMKRKTTVLEQHALGRFNTPEKVAAFIHFLHCELTETSGQLFQLDSRISQA